MQPQLGKHFIKFDDDDAVTREFLTKTVAVLESQFHVDFVCSDRWIINAKGEREDLATRANSAKWEKDKLQEGLIQNLIHETFVNQSLQVGATLFGRKALLAVARMRSEADGCEDFDLLVRRTFAGKQGYFLPKLLM